MGYEINKKILDALKNNEIDLALKTLNMLTERDKKQLLQLLGEVLASCDNKAILNPNCAAFFKRKLKPNKSFDEFYEEWLPPVTPITKNGKAIYDYFSLPTRVINFKTHDKFDEFFTLSLVHSPYANPATTLESYKAKHADTEAVRKNKNDDNLEQSELLGYGSILSDDIFGI